MAFAVGANGIDLEKVQASLFLLLIPLLYPLS